MAQARKAAAAAPQPKTDQWTVLDRNAINQPRIHKVKGQAIAFKPGQRVSLDSHVAAAFLSSASFEVLNENGDKVSSLPKQSVSQAGVSGGINLEPGQVIASLDELTKEALIARAARIPGGERLNARSSRNDVLAFLQDSDHSTYRAAQSDEPVDDVDVEEIDDEGVKKMLGDGADGDVDFS